MEKKSALTYTSTPTMKKWSFAAITAFAPNPPPYDLSHHTQHSKLNGLDLQEQVYYLQQELRKTKFCIAPLEIKVYNMENKGKQDIIQEVL